MLFVVPKTLPETAPLTSDRFDFPGPSAGCRHGVDPHGGELRGDVPARLHDILAVPYRWVIFPGIFAIVEKQSPHAAFLIELFKNPISVSAVPLESWNYGESILPAGLGTPPDRVEGLARGGKDRHHSAVGGGPIVGFAGGALPVMPDSHRSLFHGAIGFALMVIAYLIITKSTSGLEDCDVHSFARPSPGSEWSPSAVVQAREYVAEAPPGSVRRHLQVERRSGYGCSLGVAMTTSLDAIGISNNGGRQPGGLRPSVQLRDVDQRGTLLVGGVITVIPLAVGCKRKAGPN